MELFAPAAQRKVTMQGHYFVSHASGDKTVADRLVADLESRGLRCWIAPRDIPPGAIWAIAIEEAIRTSAALVLLLSRGANASEFIHREVTIAANNRKAIYPVRLDDEPPAAVLQFFVAPFQIVALSSAADRIARENLPALESVRILAEPIAARPAPGFSRQFLIYAALSAGFVLLGAIWLLKPTSVPSQPVLSTREPILSTPSVALPVITAPAMEPPKQPAAPPQVQPEPRVVAPPPVIAPSPGYATVPSAVGGALRPRTNLDSYAPPPVAADTHGMVEGVQDGPLRPRINLGQ